jgi:hypothetical protein
MFKFLVTIKLSANMPEGSAKYKTLQLQHNKNVFLGYCLKII